LIILVATSSLTVESPRGSADVFARGLRRTERLSRNYSGQEDKDECSEHLHMSTIGKVKTKVRRRPSQSTLFIRFSVYLFLVTRGPLCYVMTTVCVVCKRGAVWVPVLQVHVMTRGGEDTALHVINYSDRKPVLSMLYRRGRTGMTIVLGPLLVHGLLRIHIPIFRLHLSISLIQSILGEIGLQVRPALLLHL